MGGSAPWARKGNLPAELSSFVGRCRELTAATRLLESTRLLTLTGPGGGGKTQLALRVAKRVRRAFADGVWLVELAALRNSALLAQTVADALGLWDQTGRSPLAEVVDHLQDKRLLLVLDNCEHQLDMCGQLVAKLLGATATLRVLATSRQALRVEGEHILLVPPLPTPDPEHLPPHEDVHQYEAVRLFAERAAAVLPGFAVNVANRAAVAGICHRLDGIPLAIELAAAWLRALSPEQLLERLDDRFRLLVGGSHTALPRHRTLRAAIDWSFQLCGPQEQVLWARASVFAGGFDLEAAEAVCSGGGIEPVRVLDLVIGLVDKSILTREDHGPSARYRMLETICTYGRDRLGKTGEEAGLRRRHRDYYLSLAERCEAEWFGRDQVKIAERTRGENANLRVALEFCLSIPAETQTGLHLATTLSFHWYCCGFVATGRYWLDRALALNPEPTAARAKALYANAYLLLLQGDNRSGAAMADECRALARQRGDELMLAYGTYMRGVAAVLGGEHALADALIEDALARFAAVGELTCDAIQARVFQAVNAAHSGDHARAKALARRVLAACEPHGERWTSSYALYALALAEFPRGELEQASKHAQDALRIKKAFNDFAGMAMDVELLSWIAATAGDGRRAAMMLGAAQQIWAALGGDPLLASQSWIVPHETCERQARHALGGRAFDSAVARGAELGLDEAVAYALGEKPQPATGVPVAPDTAEVSLTRRELQVAELIAHGLTNKEIADRLVIAQRTAESHVERILTKLGFATRAQIAAWIAGRR